MIPLMGARRFSDVAVATLAALAALWVYASQPRACVRSPAPVPIQDGRAIDFSGGSPVIRDDPASAARMNAALRQIDEANSKVTFRPEPTPTPSPAK